MNAAAFFKVCTSCFGVCCPPHQTAVLWLVKSFTVFNYSSRTVWLRFNQAWLAEPVTLVRSFVQQVLATCVSRNESLSLKFNSVNKQPKVLQHAFKNVLKVCANTKHETQSYDFTSCWLVTISRLAFERCAELSVTVSATIATCLESKTHRLGVYQVQ